MYYCSVCVVGTVPELTEDNFTIQAIPQRPNGLLLALANSTDLIYAIGTREGQVMITIVLHHKMPNVPHRECTMLLTGQKSLVMCVHH